MSLPKGTPPRTMPMGFFIDWLIHDIFLCRNDAGLARILDMSQTLLSKVRYGDLNVSPRLILAVHERSGIEVATIRAKLAQGQP